MDLGHGGSGSGNEGNSCHQGKGKFHRHSADQIQQLEAYFKGCPHPDEIQRQQLSRDLGLDPKQIKFWFQNKRTQTKTQNSRADNNTLRSENEKLRCENIVMRERLKCALCPDCGGSNSESEKPHNIHTLKMENVWLKEKCEQQMSYFSNCMSKPMMSTSGIEPSSSMAGNHFIHEGVGVSSPIDHGHVPSSSVNPTSLYATSQIQVERSSIIGAAVAAMGELAELLRSNEPLWIKSGTDGRYLLNSDHYAKLFPKRNYLNTARACTESSKDSGEVAMDPIHLIEMFLDENKWKNALPTIVTKAKTIAILDTGSIGGSLRLMYEKMHILSPLVAPREFIFIRFCQPVNSNTWMMVDVSYDFMKELQDAAPNHSWKLPSGCMIQDLANGNSFITWIEHVQVDDKPSTHRLYRELICGSLAYGATRWIASLRIACERVTFSMGLTTPKHQPYGDTAEGWRNLMKVSHRVVQNFFEFLSMSTKLDYPSLTEFDNSGVRITMQKSSGQGQPDGFIVSASASLWLPVSYVNLFEFFKDDKERAQWDVLANDNPVHTIAHIATGTHHGNCISIVQPFSKKESNMLVLQESSIDEIGAMMIYAPTDLQTIMSIVNGGDADSVPILPSGFVISPDGRANNGQGSSSSSSTSSSSGSLLTVSFQILVCCSALTKQLSMESVATANTLISSTIQKIKAALNCSHLT